MSNIVNVCKVKVAGTICVKLGVRENIEVKDLAFVWGSIADAVVSPGLEEVELEASETKVTEVNLFETVEEVVVVVVVVVVVYNIKKNFNLELVICCKLEQFCVKFYCNISNLADFPQPKF